MNARRRLLAAASATFALAALTACEKPAPLVTVVSGGESVYTEANAYCFEEGTTLADDDCASRAEGIATLPVRGGQTVGVDVGDELVERGWQLVLSDPADPRSVQQSPVLDDSYFTFTAPGLAPGGSLLLTVRTLGAENEEPTGEWLFRLVPED